jgi:hypothetical protein
MPDMCTLRPAAQSRGACESDPPSPQLRLERCYRRGTHVGPEPIAEALKRIRAELLRAASPKGHG